MKRVSALAATVLAVVGLAACGGSSSHKAQALSTPQVTQAETVARQVASSCLKKGGSLRTMLHCAIPPHHGRQFVLCVLRGAPKSAHATAAIESDLVKCGERYR